MLIQSASNFRQYRPIDDEAILFTAVAGNGGLTTDEISRCEIAVIRFTAGDGKIRVSNNPASGTDGIDVFAGDTVFFSNYEVALLTGIRGGATNLSGWVTYYA